MKTFNRSYLPETIKYNKKTFVKFGNKDSFKNSKLTFEQFVINFKAMSKQIIIVNVLSRRLKGKTDLYGKPYQPSEWLYIDSEVKKLS
jgi:hypothetical protein